MGCSKVEERSEGREGEERGRGVEGKEREEWSVGRVVGLCLSLLPSNHLNLTPRWRQWFLRGQSGLLLMSCFYTIVSLGPPGLFALITLVQAASYHEVMRLGHEVTGVQGMETWCWLLWLLANLHWTLPQLVPLPPSLLLPLTFTLYLLLLTHFVLSIRHTSHCLHRYCLLAWSHAAVAFLAGQASLATLTLQHGMVWVVLAFSIITINDIMAYMCGFFLGQTPLIVLSPKKTIEGYVGGGLATILLGPLYGALLLNQPSLLCPSSSLSTLPCSPSSLSLYSSSPSLPLSASPFILHCLAISVFASTFGPVAGFLCSGFKRACDRKNFGCLIPGHGGVLDRCDCMFLMASFTYVYIETFVY